MLVVCAALGFSPSTFHIEVVTAVEGGSSLAVDVPEYVPPMHSILRAAQYLQATPSAGMSHRRRRLLQRHWSALRIAQVARQRDVEEIRLSYRHVIHAVGALMVDALARPLELDLVNQR
jgi:hypothetical protein